MDRVASRDGAQALLRFRRLLNATIGATLVLILIGGIVRVSDSGLGCGPAGSGTHGWPLCQGGFVPNGSSESIVEYSHRIAAATVSVLIALCAIFAWRNLRTRPWLVRGSIIAGFLVVGQAVLGGVTVEEDLHEYLVAGHLGLAMLLLGLLIVLRRFTYEDRAVPDVTSRSLRVLTATATVLILGTIVAGGVVAGTEGEGTANEPVVGAHLACGEEFPTCGGDSILPFGRSRLVDIQLTHRLFMYLTALSVIALVIVAIRRRVPTPAFAVLGVLLVCQILLGALNVWLGKHPGLIVAHLFLGTAVWATAVYAGTTLLPVPATRDARIDASDAATAAA